MAHPDHPVILPPFEGSPAEARARTMHRPAFGFADAAHRAVGQLRKYTGEPYIVHPLDVATIVMTVPHTVEMVDAALLHDVVEDTQVSLLEIEATFGPTVAAYVGWLTDVSRPEDGNRAARKALDREHIARAPRPAKTVKLADCLSNLRDIAAHDPGFARVYVREIRQDHARLTDGEQRLWRMLQAELHAAARLLGIRP